MYFQFRNNCQSDLGWEDPFFLCPMVVRGDLFSTRHAPVISQGTFYLHYGKEY